MGVAPSEIDTLEEEQSMKEPSKFEQMCNDLHHRIRESRRYGIRSKILDSKSDEERFTILYPYAKKYTMHQTSAKTEKSEESAIFREIGNQAFRLKKYHQSLAFYTQAVAKAPYASKYLAFAYSNRSAVLLVLRLYDDCLEDLKRTLDGKYPANMRYKIYIRQGQCYHLMQRFEEADASFSTAEQLIASSPTLYCLVRCHALLPCPNCAWAMFCSPACIEEAWHKFHKIECPAMKCIEDLKLNTFVFAHLAVRTIAQCGIENCLAYHLNQCKKTIDKDDHEAMRTRGFSISGKLISSNLEAVYHQFDEAQYLYNFLFARILLATCILKALNLESHPKAMQIGGLLLKLMRCHRMNAHEIYERFKGPDADNLCDLPIANGMYPTLGAFNHACDPNVVRHFQGKTVVLRALTRISAGEELLDTYGPHCLVERREKRRQHLNVNYFFECNCIPCSQNWPTLIQLPWKFPIAKMGNVEKQLSNAHRKVASAITEYMQKKTVSTSDVPNLVNYLELLQKHKRKLCQEYYTVQEMVKVSFVSLANTYTCNDAL
ncbi:hypothetical protein B566_EDAN012148 [Ephemera danica]|nr:hypothetical protein B566_EDAN012148 [Ephemera danica]